jgi:predicted enzyme related to lactoylglutathione lyase
MTMFKDINVVSLYVTDWEGAKKFYREVLEWPEIFGSDEFGWIEFGVEGQAHLAINRWDGPEAPPPRPGGCNVVFTVTDAQAVTAALRAKGVRCDDPVVIPGMVTYGNFYDPEGNRLQFAASAVPA